MITERTYHGLNLAISSCGKDRVCYFFLPEGLKADGKLYLEEAADKYQCTMVAISGMNWNRDMTPWPADGVFKKEKPFEGKSSQFLKELKEDYFRSIEESLSMRNPERYAVGISLSGLFLIWSLWEADLFNGVASLSGSLWYDNFVDWAKENKPVSNTIKIHLSLGDKEKNTRNQRVAIVEDATNEIADILKNYGYTVDSVVIEGTHFSPIIPRMEKALESIFSISQQVPLA